MEKDTDKKDISTKQKDAETIRVYLENEGYRALIDEDGDVYFKHEGVLYFIVCNKQFYHLFALHAGDDNFRLTASLRASEYINRKIKGVKIYGLSCDNSSYSIGYEGFYKSVDDFLSVLDSALGVCSAAAIEYKEKYMELTSISDEDDEEEEEDLDFDDFDDLTS